VRFDLTEASRSNRAPSILLVGALGRGKTVGAQLLCYQAAMAGSTVVDVDPKPDHNLERLPGMKDLVHVIELDGSDKNRGLLDPLVVAPEVLREDLTAAYLTELLPEALPTWQTQIRKAVKQVIADGNPTSTRVLELLRDSKDTAARDVGAELEVWADTGLGRLAFGDRHAKTRAVLPVTTIRTPGLALPPPGVPRADYDTQERMSAATLKLIVGFAMRLVQGNRSVHKLVHFDEAHVLLGTGDGRRFLDRINRMGRSENITLLLSTQLLGDVGEIENLIGTRLIFGQETDAEARAVLPIVGLDPDDADLVKMVRGFTNGQCLLRGIDDRVAQIKVDVVDPRILEALSTTPTTSTALLGVPA
jgi:DNA helicase HerA-like ATPase